MIAVFRTAALLHSRMDLLAQVGRSVWPLWLSTRERHRLNSNMTHPHSPSGVSKLQLALPDCRPRGNRHLKTEHVGLSQGR